MITTTTKSLVASTSEGHQHHDSGVLATKLVSRMFAATVLISAILRYMLLNYGIYEEIRSNRKSL